VSEQLDFSDSSDHTLDERGRIVIPKKYREHLKGKLAICYWMENCIALLTPEAKREWDEKIFSYVRMDTRQGRNFYRLYRKYYKNDVEMDRQGRVQIPQKLREKVGLGDEVTLVGMGNYFEIWDRETLQRLEEEETPRYAENLEACIRREASGGPGGLS